MRRGAIFVVIYFLGNNSMKTGVLALTLQGKSVAKEIADSLDDCEYIEHTGPIADTISALWGRCQGFICVMAAGIAVRAIAPLIEKKEADPCVVVVDQRGQFAISLLSGHLGGGNTLAHRVAEITGGRAVITTASDVEHMTALDLWAKRNTLHISDKKLLTAKMMKLVDTGSLSVSGLVSTNANSLPSDLVFVEEPDKADLLVSWNKANSERQLHCVPQTLYLGMGCNRGTSREDICLAFEELCEKYCIAPQAIAGVATIDVKHDEKGMIEFAQELRLPLIFYTRDQLNSVEDVSVSEAVMKAVGAKGVAEPAAILAAREEKGDARLVIQKNKWKDVTFAVAERIKERWE